MTASTLEMAADIVSAFVSNNAVPLSDLPNVIASVHAALHDLSTGVAPPQAEEPQEPAVSIKKSLTPDFLICLEDGKRFKSLKRHIRTAYGLSPEQYRAKWKLPQDYPMVAPNYAKARSDLARASGLGQQGRKSKKKK